MHARAVQLVGDNSITDRLHPWPNTKQFPLSLFHYYYNHYSGERSTAIPPPRGFLLLLLYLPECREILWFSYGSAAAAGYGGYAGYGGGGYGGGGGYREISTFVCLFVNSIPEKLLDGFRRNLVGGLGMVQGSCH